MYAEKHVFPPFFLSVSVNTLIFVPDVLDGAGLAQKILNGSVPHIYVSVHAELLRRSNPSQKERWVGMRHDILKGVYLALCS